MAIGEVCNRDVVVVKKDESALDAALLMRRFHVGDLVVIEEEGGQRIPVGILTDRDIVIEAVAEDVNSRELTVGDIMSVDLVTVNEDEDIVDTVKMMRANGIRRVPVVDRSGVLVGIVTVDDLIELLAEVLDDLTKLIRREQKREQETRR
jgi:CBS domain-containing protein